MPQTIKPAANNTTDLLRRVADLQSLYWEALGNLEAATGLDLDSTQDFQGMTVKDLRDVDAPQPTQADALTAKLNQCRNEHEALGMALGMLNQIASGKSYDASDYHSKVSEIQRHYHKGQDQIEHCLQLRELYTRQPIPKDY